MTDLSDDSSDWSSAEELEDWNQELNEILCLFCDQKQKTFEQTLSHLKTDHDFDLIDVCVRHRITAIDFIRLINYIRLNKPESNQIEAIVGSAAHRNDLFMKPVIADDRLLTYDIETHAIDCEDNPNQESDPKSLSTCQLIQQLKERDNQIKELQNRLQQMSRLLANEMSEETDRDLNVAKMSASEDQYYVSSYSHYSIHYEMLSDTIRTKAYEESILKNSQFFENKTVLDIGCGTGILSLFAAKAGARLVVAVDHSDVIYKAMEFAVDNKMESKIRFIKSKFETIDFGSHGLPLKYDIIISEWMGYFLLFEGMLDSILYARNQCLSPTGILMPNTCSLSLAGICDNDLRTRCFDFWDDVYGFKMSSMKKDIISEAQIETIDCRNIKTSVCLLKTFDLMTVGLEETQNFEATFEMSATSEGPVVGFVGWFDCGFDARQLSHSVTLSTAPFSGSTHWKQTVFVLKEPIECKAGDKISGHIKVYRNMRDIRSLVVDIQVEGRPKQVFYLS